MNSLATEPAVILIIDNDPIMMTGLAAILDMSGYECHCARGPEAALKAVRTLPLDLILCDVNLGCESGIELCRELREQPGMDDVPLMFMSSAQGPDIVRRSTEAGAAYYLRKPFDPAVLLDLVSKALWMPHLVQSRVNQVHASRQATPAVPKSNLREASLQTLRLPMA
jgi:DNA-binding response OmpR family regulator